MLVYAGLAYYFSQRMVRLILLLSPPASILTAVAVWWVVEFSAKAILPTIFETPAAVVAPQAAVPGKEKKRSVAGPAGLFDPILAQFDTPFMRQYGNLAIASVLCVVVFWSMAGFVNHSFMMAEGLSSPQIMISTKDRNGNLFIIDDFREAYWWLRDHTPEDSRIMAWWDYGYQINGIANRTSIADGNTWNFEHIALLGRTLLSQEKEAWSAARHLADYVLVWTGRFVGYMSDDLAKMPQLANIAGSIYPEIDRQGYFVDRNSNPTPAARTCLLYQLTFFGKDDGTIQLKYFKEVYTSKHSMVRIYKVLDVAPRTPFGKYAPELKLGQLKTR